MRGRPGSVQSAGKLIPVSYICFVSPPNCLCGSRELAVAVEASYIEVDGFISKIIQETQRTR